MPRFVDGTAPEPEIVESNITVFPNPVRDIYNLLIKDRPFERFTIEIIDVSGRIVQTYIAKRRVTAKSTISKWRVKFRPALTL